MIINLLAYRRRTSDILRPSETHDLSRVHSHRPVSTLAVPKTKKRAPDTERRSALLYIVLKL
ncbi:MAG: hypothetical protein LBR50_06785 [Tannerella sp.]|nr:hypothetical protein [Tannerella sp.]